jgi:hypothetical protein
MAKMVLTRDGWKIDPVGKAIDKKLERRRQLQQELDSLPKYAWVRRMDLKQEIKTLNESLRIGVAVSTGIDPGRVR